MQVMEEDLVIEHCVSMATMFVMTFGKQLSGKNYCVSEKLGTLKTADGAIAVKIDGPVVGEKSPTFVRFFYKEEALFAACQASGDTQLI